MNNIQFSKMINLLHSSNKTRSNSLEAIKIVRKDFVKDSQKVPANCDSSKVLLEKEEMEKAIIQENIKKYHQCEDSCPFMKGELESVQL